MNTHDPTLPEYLTRQFDRLQADLVGGTPDEKLAELKIGLAQFQETIRNGTDKQLIVDKAYAVALNHDLPEHFGDDVVTEAIGEALAGIPVGGNGHTDWEPDQKSWKDTDSSEAPVVPIDLWNTLDPPSLPLGLLPEVIEHFAVEQGELMGADPAGLAMGALVVCAAAIPDSVVLQSSSMTRRGRRRLACGLS